MFSPGAAIPTHGPATVKVDGCPSGAREAVDSTYGCHQDGMETEVTAAQFRGSAGRAGSVSGLDSHDAAPRLPAAATTTAFLSTAAYRIAAPKPAWSTARSAGRQVATETSMTRAPRSAACTIALANVAASDDARPT